MKIHSDYLTYADVTRAFESTRASGLITPDVGMVQLARDGSRSYHFAYLVQLGTFNRDSRTDGKKRGYKNSGVAGADNRLWAATWEEWGWFISALFALDSDAKIGQYKNAEDFHKVTEYKFELEG